MLARRIIERARELRVLQTAAEGLLWAALRRKRLSGLKFRRQHPIGPFIADFACIRKRFIIEVDGGYHDLTFEDDVSRQQLLEAEGWTVFRVSNEEVLSDVEGVIREIFQQLQLPYDVRPVGGRRSSSLVVRRREGRGK